MPKISQRVAATPASPIRKLVPFADAAKQRGVKIHHLNIGQPDIKTPAAAIQKLQTTPMEVIEYTHSAGTESYRQKLSTFYSKYGFGINPNQIIVTNGGSEALLFAVMACADAGDEIIIPEPFYANYNGFAISLDVKIKTVGSTIQENFALPAIEAFEKVISPRTKAIMICNPGNPTGYLYSRQELEALAALVKKHDLYLIADEVYRDFCYGEARHVSIFELEGINDHAIVLDSVSKRYSACGARIGVFMTKNANLYSAAMKLAQARLSPSSVTQILCEALCDTPADYFAQVKAEYDTRRQLLMRRLSAMKGVICPNPEGAFYMLVHLPIDDSDKFAQWLLESFSHNNETLMLAPATGFYATEGLGKQEVRMAYVLNTDDLNRAMDCLEKALEIYPGRRD